MTSIWHHQIHVESGLYKSLRLHQLAISLECSAAAWIPRGMGTIDQTLCYYGLILSPCEWTVPRGVVPAAKGLQTRLFACTVAFHTGRRRLGYLHDEAVFSGIPLRFPNSGDPGGDSTAPICGRHYFFRSGL